MPHKILIVEDHLSTAQSISIALEMEQFQTVCASSGAEAKELIESENPDCILLDVGLPDCDGFNLFRDIRKSSDIPIIFLTARDALLDKVSGLDMGADDYITKPFQTEEAVARIRAVLRRAQPQSSTDDDSGVSEWLQANSSDYSVSYFGTTIKVTPAEFHFLSNLAAHPGRVYDKKQLTRLFSGENTSVSDETLRAHIKKLRAKLRAIKPDFDPIENHRGFGYSLRLPK